MSMNVYEIIRAPRVSEKTARLQEVSNQYAFEVAREATKADIKAAIEQLFGVTAEAVHQVNVKGKAKWLRQAPGSRGNSRKAYVKLAEGQSIDVMTARV